ncbi:MAG: sporulation protein YabP [Oscillospiraceae bacterium]|nr:sporulation protein YabP [Oscillospiraceae bacterium]
MAYEEKKLHPEGPHHVILEDREHLSISGVEDVESFDENAVVVYTCKGVLVVRGTDLRIDRLSLDGGDLSVEGMVDSLAYETKDRESGGGLLSRLFR